MYYTIRIQNKNDGTEVRSIAAFTSRDEAEIRFHSFLAADMSNKDMKSCLIMVIDENGSTYLSRHWVATSTETEE